MNGKIQGIQVEEMWMTAKPQAHPEEEILERYAMGQLTDPELGAFEEHLLFCEVCQERLDEATEYVSLVREAAGNLGEVTVEEPWWRRWREMELPRLPAPALAAAMMVLVSLVVWQPWKRETPGQWQTVELETLRGGGEMRKGAAAAEYALDLRLDVSGLDVNGATGQIVTAEGRVVAELPVNVVNGKVSLRRAEGLGAGQYWVRLKKNSETIREYALPVDRR